VEARHGLTSSTSGHRTVNFHLGGWRKKRSLKNPAYRMGSKLVTQGGVGGARGGRDSQGVRREGFGLRVGGGRQRDERGAVQCLGGRKKGSGIGVGERE